MTRGNFKIIIVDDDYSTRQLISIIIRSYWKCEVIEAEDGSDALQKIVQEVPDIVILDMTMPFLSGIETLKTIRNTVGLYQIPVIACTSVTDPDSVNEIIASGVNDYLVKPIDKSTLIKKIKKFIK